VSSACSSEAGERKMPLSLAEPAEFAEKTMIRKTVKANSFPLGMLCLPCEPCGLERSDHLNGNDVFSLHSKRFKCTIGSVTRENNGGKDI
jgi:hypothetical protein